MDNYEGDRLDTICLSSLFMGGIATGNCAEVVANGFVLRLAKSVVFASEVPLRCSLTICRF